jgi:alpha/beta superfamily hydrolase
VTRAEFLTLTGPAGQIEARLELPDDATAAPVAFGVACHPHPLYGGAMDNKVTHTLARAMNECGAPCFRFNFRGVGASAGAFDNGRGEADDLAAVVEEGRRRFPGAPLWLGGFSFGAFVALRGAQTLQPVKLAAVAPPVSRFELGSVAHPDCAWMLAQGDADDVVDPRAVLAWAAEQPRKPTLHVLAGAGHFFHGRLHELKPLLVGFFRSP